MYKIMTNEVIKIEPTTFRDLGMAEDDLEEILRNSIDIVCDDEESLLIVGRQVQNEQRGRSDLTAIDQDGNIVLIEIKRDRQDILQRGEAFEFQAIRYAASYATIGTPDDLVKKIYAPYIEKYRSEFELGPLTTFELGKRKLIEFLRENDVETRFNERQRIILVASDFDKQTLSAVAWLNRNNLDISCYQITPYKLEEGVYIYAERVLPVADYDDYYVNLMDRDHTTLARKPSTRRNLPRIYAMLEWGVVKEGDVLQAKGRDSEAVLLANGNITVNGEEQSLQAWLKGVYGWSSVQTYAFTVHKESGKSLGKIRAEFMEKKAADEPIEM